MNAKLLDHVELLRSAGKWLVAGTTEEYSAALEGLGRQRDDMSCAELGRMLLAAAEAPPIPPEVEQRILADVAKATEQDDKRHKALIAAHGAIAAAVWGVTDDDMRKMLERVLMEVGEALQ